MLPYCQLFSFINVCCLFSWGGGSFVYSVDVVSNVCFIVFVVVFNSDTVFTDIASVTCLFFYYSYGFLFWGVRWRE